MEDNTMTFGQYLVRLSPGETENAADIKKRFAGIIDVLHNDLNSQPRSAEEGRTIEVAIMQAEQACMWAVKAVTK